MFSFLKMGKSKEDRQFEILDGRLIDIQGKLHRLPEILTAINNLRGKVDVMSSNIDRIEKEAGDLTEDVAQVRTAIDGLTATISDLKTTVADLQAQVAQGQLDQARLDAAAAKLEKADDDLDAITLPSAEPSA